MLLTIISLLSRTILYPISYLLNKYYLYLHINKYKNFYSDDQKDGKTLLMLCHCRKAGVPLVKAAPGSFLGDLSSYDITTVDRNPKSNPHLVCDILSTDLEKCLDDRKYDLIALFNCSCHTEEVNHDPNILSRLSKMVKDDGFLLLKNNNVVGQNLLNYKGILYLYYEIPELLSCTSFRDLFNRPYYLTVERHMFIYSFHS